MKLLAIIVLLEVSQPNVCLAVPDVYCYDFVYTILCNYRSGKVLFDNSIRGPVR